MRGRWVVAVLTTLLVSTIAACTSDAKPSQPGTQTSRATSAAPQTPGALGAPGCHPASPVTVLNSFLSQVQGTGQGATPWGLLMFPHALPARVGDQEKIVWRMTGTGSLSMEAIDPAGTHHPLVWVRTPTSAATETNPEMSGARATALTHPAAGTSVPPAAPPPQTSGFAWSVGRPRHSARCPRRNAD